MVSQELEQLLALQETDAALAELLRREESAHARLAGEQAQVEEFKLQMAAEKKLLDDALKEHKGLDLDLTKLEEQVKKYSIQMYEVKTNKEYGALRDEIDKNKGEGQKIEDKILQLMLKEDELKSAAVRRAGELKEKTDALKRTEAEVTEELGKIAAERESMSARRQERGGLLSRGLLEKYERIRAVRAGTSLSRVIESPSGGEAACSECHMTIRPQVIVEIYKREELISCEYCGRILYLDIEPAAASADTGAAAAPAAVDPAKES